MSTTYYVVPAGRFFDSEFASFPSRALAEREIARWVEKGGAGEYGVYEVRLVSGTGKMTLGRTMHVVGDRHIITGKHYAGGYQAHDDGLGEDTSPYGYGATPEEAIAALLAMLTEDETPVSLSNAA